MRPDRWHSSIQVDVELPPGTRLRDVRSFLLADGYVQSGDVLCMRRSDQVEVWQTESLVGVFMFKDDQEVYFAPPYSSHCTRASLQFLLPWLPFAFSAAFVAAAERLGAHFGAALQFGGQTITGSELLRRMETLAAELTQRVDAPGSEFLAIAIAEDLPL